MAIVNGQYVIDPIGTGGANQRRYFGEYTSTDMSDYSAAALQLRMKELENQFNLDVWNMNNEYNTPKAQMLRYQDAGLNPNLIYGQQNTSSAPGSASMPSIHPTNPKAKKQQRAIEAVNSMINVARSARETFDYLEYGKDISKYQEQSAFYNSAIARNRADQSTLETAWQNYLMGSPLGEDVVSRLETSPRGQMYKFQTDTANQRYLQVKGLVDMIPDQKARIQVLKQLEDYRLSIMEGQNDFILNIHTGLGEGFDSFVKMLCYLAVSKLQ